ncbi:PE-PGRS family protein [Embleya sp. NPDC020630]|uniref:PE-PGRS family protein n=1 Tax=Embleya sp. NPDC020630 TaxID=3363979 RepID=UPI00379E5ED2
MMSPPPQWEQNANRDTHIVDPVVTIQELSRFRPLRTTRIDYALVFTTAKGGLDTFLPPHRPSRAEIATRRWTSVYSVDVGLHEARALLALPSNNDAFPFEVTMGCDWQVADPAAFVASGERDVPAMVQRLVDGLIRPVLRAYAMEDSAVAEKDAQGVLAAAGPLGTAAGLRVRCGIQVRRDEAALEHARKLREIEFARQTLDPQHTLLMREEELAAERALAQGRHRHLIELQTQNLDHQRELVRGEQELERQAIEAQKIRYYTHYLERGGPSAMAFQLAQHPEDARLVMENLRQDQLNALQAQLQVALQALGGGPGGLEEHQLDEPRRLAANVIREVLSARLGPMAPGREPVVGEAPSETASIESPADGEAVTADSVEAGFDTGDAPPQDAGAVFGYRVPNPPPVP